jgi:hypothetical protein
MRNFKKSEISEVKALQYGQDKEAENYVKSCVFYAGQIIKLPEDLLGDTEGSFKAVQTSFGYSMINKGDWIVFKNEEISIIPDGCFRAIYEEF